MSARDHDYLLDVCKATLGYGHLPAAPVVPITRPVALAPNDESPAYREAFDSVVQGRECDFYFDDTDPFAFYSIEQEIELLKAIRRARSLIGASDATRWAIVDRELTNQAAKYATCKAKDAGQ